MENELTEEQLRALFAWIDAIPLSRPKRNIARDFSDGVLIAEVIHAYFPQLVELHNYPAASSIKQKMYNFETLNKRVLKKIGYQIEKQLVEDAVNCKPGAIESILNTLQFNMAKYREKRATSIEATAGSSGSYSNSSKQESNNKSSNSSVIRQSADNSQFKAQSSNTPNQSFFHYEQALQDKDMTIKELQETIEILELKVSKLEQLVRLKDLKIQKLSQQQN